MQTFLPHPSFAASSASLDTPRLGKQRAETIQLIKALTVPDYGWRHHPAALMWKGFEEALAAYGTAVSREWVSRGYRDTCEEKYRALLGLDQVRTQDELARLGLLPPWLGDPEFHLAHRSNLVRKDPEHYLPLFPGTPDDLDYVWPVRASSLAPA